MDELKPRGARFDAFDSLQSNFHIGGEGGKGKVEIRPRVYAWTHEAILNFGKFRGNSIYNVWLINPEYIEWIILNIKTFILISSSIDHLANTQTLSIGSKIPKYCKENNGKLFVDLTQMRQDSLFNKKYSFNSFTKQVNINKLNDENFYKNAISNADVFSKTLSISHFKSNLPIVLH